MTSASELIDIGRGYTARAATLDDVSIVLALYHAVSMDMVGHTEETLEELIEEFTAPRVDPAQDTRLVLAADGEIAGFGLVGLGMPQNPWQDVYVHPRLKDQPDERHFVSDHLMAWANERAQAGIALAPPDQRVVTTAYAYHHDDWHQAQLMKYGLSRVRSSYLMWIDFAEPVAVPAPPAGITLRTATADEDWRRIFDARREAWHDMWGYVMRDYEEDYADWLHHWKETFAEGYWFVAEAEGQVVAVSLCEDEFEGDRTQGYVATFGVRRAYRKQGLGQCLLLHSLREMQTLGLRAVGLHVDGSSLTGAVQLYERAGMHIKMRYDRFEKELRPGIDPRVQNAEG